MNKAKPSKKSSVVFAGKIGEVIHTVQDDGRIFEKFCRPPGTRLIIISPDNKILITQEYREETDSVDLRLPGGKVCDTLEEYNKLRADDSDILQAARKGAIKEALEEAGIEVEEMEFIERARDGATVEWDLYYFLVRKYKLHPNGQNLEAGEDIKVSWMTINDIKLAIKAGQMQEWRSAGILLGKIFPLLEG